LRYGRFAREMM